MQRYAFDLVVLSTDAISERKGFLYQSHAEAALASVVAGNADHVVMAAAHFKFGQSAPYVGPDPRHVGTLVTSQAPQGTLADAFAAWGTSVRIAE